MSKVQKTKVENTVANSSNKLYFLLLFCIPLFLYLKTTSYKFTGFDDEQLISENIKFLSDLANVPKVFSKEAFIDKTGHFYRPLQTISYMVDVKVSGGNKTGMYHFTNVFLFSVIACFMFLLLRKLSISPKMSLLGTLLYIVHPLFVFSVAWIPSRGDLLLTLFSLLSFLSLIDYLQHKNIRSLIFHWIMFALALFCKETAAVLPLVFIIYLICYGQFNLNDKTQIALLLIYIGSEIGWFLMRSEAIGDYSNPNDLVGFNAFIASLQVVPESITLFFIPFGIEPFPVFSLSKTAIGFTLIILMFLALYKSNMKNKKAPAFGLCWFFIFLLPSLFFKNVQIDYLNHRFFLPLFGVLIFLLMIIPKDWFEKDKIKNIWVLVAVLLIFSGLSFSKLDSFSNPQKFYTAATGKDSRSALAFYNMGNIMKNVTGNYDAAINNYTKAIQLQSKYPEAYNNRGNAYFKKRQYNLAINDYNISIEQAPDYKDAYYDRGNAYNNQGLYEKAIVDFTKTIELDPKYEKAYNNRGFAYFSISEFEKAIEDYTKAIGIKSGYARAYNNRANAYQKIGESEKACSDFKKAAHLGATDAYKSLERFCR